MDMKIAEISVGDVVKTILAQQEAADSRADAARNNGGKNDAEKV